MTANMDRVRDILKSDLVALLREIPDVSPEDAIGDIMSELQGALREARADLGKLEVERHDLVRTRESARVRLDSLAGQLQEALDSGDEVLARKIIATQIEIEGRLPALQERLVELEAGIAEAGDAVERIRTRRNDLNARIADHESRLRRGEASEIDLSPFTSQDEPDWKDELDDLVRDSAIEDRLAAAKVAHNGKGE